MTRYTRGHVKLPNPANGGETAVDGDEFGAGSWTVSAEAVLPSLVFDRDLPAVTTERPVSIQEIRSTSLVTRPR